LGWVGGKAIEEPYYFLGQLFTIFYFIYFIFILPLLGIFEIIVNNKHNDKYINYITSKPFISLYLRIEIAEWWHRFFTLLRPLTLRNFKKWL
jgi:hypothetical protein